LPLLSQNGDAGGLTCSPEDSLRNSISLSLLMLYVPFFLKKDRALKTKEEYITKFEA
jgi:hypothetical protein